MNLTRVQYEANDEWFWIISYLENWRKFEMFSKDKLYQISYSFSIRLSKNISCDNISIGIRGSSWLFIAKRGLRGWQRIYMRNFVISILSYPLFYDILLSPIHVSQFISRSSPTNTITVFLSHRNIQYN